jgi:glucan 1,3-beta-glucosidase
MVIEPWVTPSLFYQFLGSTKKWGRLTPEKTGMDSYSFCRALGPEEANRQLRQHWDTWVTEKEIAEIASLGVDTVRIPVGDWMFKPYYPYIGCYDGAHEQVDRVIKLCAKYSLKVMIDLHAVRGSQNGLDNSGRTEDLRWTYNRTEGEFHFSHWSIRAAEWAGHFDTTKQTYTKINYTNINNTLDIVERIIIKYRSYDNVVAFEPLNEPWWFIPLDVLQNFYWESYKLVRKLAPNWVTIFHDSFRLTVDNWSNFMLDCPNYALDTHLYQAWAWPNTVEYFQASACYDNTAAKEMETAGIPVIVGEWSLATDNCAMWLNGFNDDIQGYPNVKCEMVKCPDPYMGPGQPNAPPDPEVSKLGPFGTGDSFEDQGMCPRDKPFFNDESPDIFSPSSSSDQGGSRSKRERQNVLTLAKIKLHTFDQPLHGHFFWNFRTEFEPRWSLLQAAALGWIPDMHTGNLTSWREIEESCTGMASPNVPTVSPPTHDAPLQALVTRTVYGVILLLCLLLVLYYWNGRQLKLEMCRTEQSYERIPDAI